MRWAYSTLALCASPGRSCFLRRRRDNGGPLEDAGRLGPSFPATPLIQDDGLLRRDFARRGFPAARRFCTGKNLTADSTDDTDLHGSDGNGQDESGSCGRENSWVLGSFGVSSDFA